MSSLNPIQIQAMLTHLNIIVSELYLLRQRNAELEVENRRLAGEVAKLTRPHDDTQQGNSPSVTEGEING